MKHPKHPLNLEAAIALLHKARNEITRQLEVLEGLLERRLTPSATPPRFARKGPRHPRKNPPRPKKNNG